MSAQSPDIDTKKKNDSYRKDKSNWLGIIVVAILILCVLVIVNMIVDLWTENRTLDEFEVIYNVRVPDNATNVIFEGTKWSSQLYFEVPDESSISQFVSTVCSEGLHTGFDPFNWEYATNATVRPIEFQDGYRMFSVYSPNTSDLISGNHCDLGMQTFVVRLDKSHSNYVSLYMETRGSCQPCEFD